MREGNKEEENVIQRELVTVGSSFISSCFFPLYTSPFTLQTAFIVEIDSNLNIPLSRYLWNSTLLVS
ncbi:hypothetical protein KAI78_07405 [bacterium]|nr:hypothetical protein [bacterium]